MKHTDSYSQKPDNFLKRSLRGYARFFRGILWLIAATCLVGLTGFLVVYPLWYFASGYKNGYSLAALGFLLLAVFFFLVGKLKASVRGAGGFGLWLKTRFRAFLKRALFVFLAAAALYLIFFLFARGYIPVASGIALVYLVVLGVVLAGRRDSA
ncbi:MAG: hypothetical protein LBT33_06735 [Spirochaetia bacterium]|nr:hypothetical protein [Spirochaetia bacterium]